LGFGTLKLTRLDGIASIESSFALNASISTSKAAAASAGKWTVSGAYSKDDRTRPMD
jgi:hypothetical protein